LPWAAAFFSWRRNLVGESLADDRAKVEVVLLLKPGTAVKVAETKTTTEPEPRHCDDG
jgi:hypothetical protein